MLSVAFDALHTSLPTSGGAGIMAHRTKWLRGSASVRPGRPTSGMPRPLISVIHTNADTWSSMAPLGEHQSYPR